VRQDGALSEALERKRLLPVEDLNRGFTRPSYPGQVGDSYAQSGLVVNFIHERWGKDMVEEMLDLYAEEGRTDRVIPKATNMSLEEFNHAMFDYLDEVIHDRWKTRATPDPDRLDYFLRRLERSPADPDLLLEVAWLHYAKNELNDAREKAEKALKLKPESAEAMEILARVAQKSGRGEETIRLAQQALDTGGERYHSRMVLGLVYEASGETARAIEEYEKAKAVRPRYVWKDSPYEKLAELYEASGRKADALAVRTELVALRDTDFPGQIEIAKAYLADGTRDMAIRLLEETLEIIPFDASVYGRLGKAYLDDGNAKAAVKALDRAVTIEPKDALYQYDLAEAYSHLGDGEKALKHAWEAHRLDPDLIEAEELIEELGG
jgi:tetratricopeptide (TPR) repeat protein